MVHHPPPALACACRQRFDGALARCEYVTPMKKPAKPDRVLLLIILEVVFEVTAFFFGTEYDLGEIFGAEPRMVLSRLSVTLYHLSYFSVAIQVPCRAVPKKCNNFRCL